jgi:hypothetical protein
MRLSVRAFQEHVGVRWVSRNIIRAYFTTYLSMESMVALSRPTVAASIHLLGRLEVVVLQSQECEGYHDMIWVSTLRHDRRPMVVPSRSRNGIPPTVRRCRKFIRARVYAFANNTARSGKIFNWLHGFLKDEEVLSEH